MKKVLLLVALATIVSASMAEARFLNDLCRFVSCAKFWDPPAWCND
jgi:hypothetical protein